MVKSHNCDHKKVTRKSETREGAHVLFEICKLCGAQRQIVVFENHRSEGPWH